MSLCHRHQLPSPDREAPSLQWVTRQGETLIKAAQMLRPHPLQNTHGLQGPGPCPKEMKTNRGTTATCLCSSLSCSREDQTGLPMQGPGGHTEAAVGMREPWMNKDSFHRWRVWMRDPPPLGRAGLALNPSFLPFLLFPHLTHWFFNQTWCLGCHFCLASHPSLCG